MFDNQQPHTVMNRPATPVHMLASAFDLADAAVPMAIDVSSFDQDSSPP